MHKPDIHIINAVSAAQTLARKFKRPSVQPLDLLYGLLQTDVIKQFLIDSNIDPAMVERLCVAPRNDLSQRKRYGVLEKIRQYIFGIPMDADAKRVLSSAFRNSEIYPISATAQVHTVESLHLLLSILDDGHTDIANALSAAGADLGSLRKHLIQKLSR